MNFENLHRVYFVGIGGIGMSALARYFTNQGKKVAGYDRTETSLTSELVSEGMEIHYSDDINLIPAEYKTPASTLIVLTPAVPTDHSELQYFREHNFEIKKRAEVLGLISKSKDVMAIAGTHGKTTTSTMVAHLLKNSQFGCNAFLGGISINYNTNLLLDQNSNFVVVEADEYDRSFHHLYPKAAIVTAMDADHLDIYGTHEAYIDSFRTFMEQISKTGFMVIKKGLEKHVTPSETKVFTYSLAEKADFYATDINIREGRYEYNVVTPGEVIANVRSGFPGLLNVENGVAAIAMAYQLGVPVNDIKKSMETFAGVKRRFEYYIKTDRLVYLDDYGHHPEELRYTIQSVKELYPGKKITGIFQPHLYSRTNDLADDFAASLSLLDEIILLEIYPAREKPIPGVTSEMLLNKVKSDKKWVCQKKDLIDFLDRRELPEVLITMGAGDIDKYTGLINKLLTSKLKNKN